MTTVKVVRWVTWGLIVALAVATAWIIYQSRAGSETAASQSIGGPFTLVGMDGKTVTEKNFAGRPHGIFFGYTHCPDVCPTTLSEFSVLSEKLGPDAQKFDLVFITVDPSRDTPEVLKSYLSSFPEKVYGLSGSEEQIADVVAKFRVYRNKVPGENGEYTMDHTASVFLFDASGAFKGTIAYTEPEEDSFAKLKRLISG
jgi:protein SCO1